jgi:hypothetical protein
MDIYKRKYIVYELIKEATGRDFSALSKAGANIRALRVRCIFDFERALKVINWDKNKQNLYIGCAKIKSIPDFTFNPKERKNETSEWYHKKFDELIETYDLFFDFDKSPEDSWEDLIKEVNSLKEYLNEYKVPYYLLFSGNKGFQIIIDGKYLPIEKIERGNVYPHKDIAEKVKKMLNLKFLDLANNGINSRLRKIPYSLVPNGQENEQEMNIAFPLDDVQFEHFRVENMKAKYILSSTKLVRRGTLERFQNLSLEEKKENLRNFISIFAFK